MLIKKEAEKGLHTKRDEPLLSLLRQAYSLSLICSCGIILAPLHGFVLRCLTVGSCFCSRKDDMATSVGTVWWSFSEDLIVSRYNFFCKYVIFHFSLILLSVRLHSYIGQTNLCVTESKTKYLKNPWYSHGKCVIPNIDLLLTFGIKQVQNSKPWGWGLYVFVELVVGSKKVDWLCIIKK